MLLRLLGIGSVAGISFMIQGFIPGVQNLYPWAFPLIMGVVYAAFLALHVASDYRLSLDERSVSPLSIAFPRLERTLVREDIIRGREHLWRIEVRLVNTSDSLPVSTSQVILLAKRRWPDGVERNYALHPITDLCGLYKPKGHVMAENEYLGPRDSRTGDYYFLDNDWHGQKPVDIHTWGNVHIVDSFGTSHRSEFKPMRFAIESESSTEDSLPEEAE